MCDVVRTVNSHQSSRTKNAAFAEALCLTVRRNLSRLSQLTSLTIRFVDSM